MSKKLPTVAIIGQTNVGKSSLFNRIMGQNQAIVAREAGTTRDPVIGKVSYKQHDFWLVDTAGLKTAEDDFEATIQEQIDEASDAADVILVTLDATLLVSDQDRSIAKKALKSKKPVILLLNKTDLASALPSEEFLRLGIKEIIRTSAEHARGIEQLLNKVTELLPSVKQKENDDQLTIALIGRPNAGKSNLFNTLAKKQQAIVSSKAGTTRDVNKASIGFYGKDIHLLDTAGIRRSGKIETGIEKFSVLRSLQAIEQSDVCLLLMDVNEHSTALDQKLAGIIKEAGKGLVLVITKWDSLEEKDPYSRDQLAKQIAFHFQHVPWAQLVFTSAVTGQNVAKILELATDIQKRREQKIKTSELNKLLQNCVEKHPPAGLKNTHPKLRYMVQTDTNPPWFVVYGSNLKQIHWSYERYLERSVREKYDYAGCTIKFSFRQEEKDRTKSK